jgi:hypothetical protein
LAGKVDVPAQAERKQLSNLKISVNINASKFQMLHTGGSVFIRDTFPDPVIALPHISRPVNAKGMHAAWNTESI